MLPKFIDNTEFIHKLYFTITCKIIYPGEHEFQT